MNNLNITYRQIEYFIKFYEIGFYKYAAQACGITTATVREGIENIENQLNNKLFIRNPKGINIRYTFTQEGHNLYKICLEIKESFNKLNYLKK